MSDLTHFDDAGNSRMVDVGNKQVTHRTAIAEAIVLMRPETLRIIRGGTAKKGDVLGVARLAGIMAAKQTSHLIPLCHPLFIDKANVDFSFADECRLTVHATVSCEAKTGVEMEALTAASVAALTVYDMCKAVDREMEIQSVRLLEKSGGRSGQFTRTQPVEPKSH
ncbi:MAG: cyclic pyranopterin monophosphate synthase MoaC [Planctomycetaceae bacterium]|nr:cyclic pyranopterin monophosphate synthase MoaC [Planctomycetaceae bacterium]